MLADSDEEMKGKREGKGERERKKSKERREEGTERGEIKRGRQETQRAKWGVLFEG